MTEFQQRQPAAHANATRKKIVEAAVKVFADRGFDAASTREIAAAADIKQGLLTYHFPNKDLLWRAAAAQVFATLRESVAGRLLSLHEASEDERIKELIRTYVRTMAAHPEFIRFITDQGHRFDERTEWLVENHVKPGFEALQQLGVLRALQADDKLPNAFFALLGASTLIFSVPANCLHLTGVDPREEAAIDAHAEFVTELFLRQR